jgi:hypothetical protein
MFSCMRHRKENPMLQSLMLFLAPSAAPVQAVPSSPPAVARPAPGRRRRLSASLGFALRVAGNAVGFAALFAGCWLALQLLQAIL